jgi:hypothetical protein
MTKINVIIIVSHSFHIYLLTEITTVKVKGAQFYVLASGTKLASSDSLNDTGSPVFWI